MAQDASTMRTAAIRSQIELTRNELGHTIDAIQDRLSPQRVMQEAKQTLADATVGRAKHFAERMNEAVQAASRSPQVTAVVDKARNNPTLNAVVNQARNNPTLNAVVNRARNNPTVHAVLASARRNPTVARVVEQARRNPAAAAFIGSAVSAMLVTMIARSRR